MSIICERNFATLCGTWQQCILNKKLLFEQIMIFNLNVDICFCVCFFVFCWKAPALTSANSMNFGRLLPQISYSIYAYMQVLFIYLFIYVLNFVFLFFFVVGSQWNHYNGEL